MASHLDTRTWLGQVPIQSVYTAGIGGQIFFRALKERGELVGTRCPTCHQVFVPARQFCERCFAELTEQLQVGPEGTLRSFTFCYLDRDERPLLNPVALALVQLDRATTFFLHKLLKVKTPSDVRFGSRVSVVVKPKAKRAGSILDIEGFRVLDPENNSPRRRGT